MALTDVQRAFYRTRLGAQLDEADLEERLARLGDDALVAVEVLEERLATAIAGGPLKFTVPGEYSEDRSENVAQLKAKIDELRGGPGGGSVVRVVPAESRHPGR